MTGLQLKKEIKMGYDILKKYLDSNESYKPPRRHGLA